jgi:hypothetical protein
VVGKWSQHNIWAMRRFCHQIPIHLLCNLESCFRAMQECGSIATGNLMSITLNYRWRAETHLLREFQTHKWKRKDKNA